MSRPELAKRDGIPQFLRFENGYKVLRITHRTATVDWYMKDNAEQITHLTWKKL